MEQESKIWYVLIENQKLGPFTADELLQEEPQIPVIPEKFTKNSLVWKTGMISWLRAADVPEFGLRLNPVTGDNREFNYSSSSNLVSKEYAKTIESAAQKSSSSIHGDKSSQSTKLEIPKLDDIVKGLKNSFQNYRRSNPLAVAGAAVAAGLIIIFFTYMFISNRVENRQEERKLAAEIMQRERVFRERQEQREQAYRDSLERVERVRLLALEEKARLDSLARIQTRRRAAAPASPPSKFFTDPRDSINYRIHRFGTITWFLDDLHNGRRFSWQQAATACPQGWRLPDDKDWRALAAILKSGAGSYFVSNHYWWSAENSGADSWYLSRAALVCYSGGDNRSAVHRVRCVKE
ncbi:MAG: GYF domain-containing protein [Chitinispirillia bacterium]|nr:GYF domain-containing protein [Chitinispirillia bacterium]